MVKPTSPIPAAPGFTPPPVAAKKSKRTAAFKPKAPPKPPKVKAPPKPKKPRKPRKPRKPKKKAEPKKKAPETAFLTATVFPSAGVWTLPGQPGRMRLKSAVIQGVVLGSGAPPRAFALRLLSGGTPFFASYASADSVGNADTVEVSFGGGLSQGILHLGDLHFSQSGLPTDGVEITENGGVQIQMIGYQASDITPAAVFSYTYTL
jgi:hypothetical protein